MNLLHHLFIPHHKNNHRSKLLHNSTLVGLILFFALASSFALIVHRTNPQVLGISYQITDQELLNLTNYERAQQGIPPLAMNSQLTQAASAKAANMFAKNYWAHFAPDGTSPWDFIRGAGYNYIYAGENLAKGFTTSSDAMKAWMASPTHRENILSPNFKDVGFAVSEGTLQGEDTVLIVQMFGARSNPAIVNNSSLTPIAINDTQKTQGTQSAAPAVRGSVGAQQVGAGGTIENSGVNYSPVYDVIFGTKAITFIMLASLLVALVLDFVIVEKKKIPRSVGNNIDHIILITIFIAFLFIAKLGNII